jgi:arrestin-related trafficking adapter 3/6
MQSFIHSHSERATLAGYLEVNSLRGHLFYLPESIHRAIHLEENPIPPIFQTRTVRPHRIHIARVHADGPRKRGGKPATKRRRTVSIIFGKLAGPKNSAKRFFKSVIRTTAVDTRAEPTEIRSPVQSTPTPIAEPLPARSRPSIRRPFSWAPGVNESSRMRPSLLSRRESKRRSTAIMAPTLRHSVAGPIGQGILSPVLLSEEGNRSSPQIDTVSSPVPRGPDEKPIASGNGVSVSIALAEPCLFLQGFEQGDLAANRSTAMLRGSLVLKVSKVSKIKSVTLKFKGTATTKWPEGELISEGNQNLWLISSQAYLPRRWILKR